MLKSPFSGPKSIREFENGYLDRGTEMEIRTVFKNIMIISKYDTVVFLHEVYDAVAHSSLFFYSDRIRQGVQMQSRVSVKLMMRIDFLKHGSTILST